MKSWILSYLDRAFPFGLMRLDFKGHLVGWISMSSLGLYFWIGLHMSKGLAHYIVVVNYLALIIGGLFIFISMKFFGISF